MWYFRQNEEGIQLGKTQEGGKGDKNEWNEEVEWRSGRNIRFARFGTHPEIVRDSCRPHGVIGLKTIHFKPHFYWINLNGGLVSNETQVLFLVLLCQKEREGLGRVDVPLLSRYGFHRIEGVVLFVRDTSVCSLVSVVFQCVYFLVQSSQREGTSGVVPTMPSLQVRLALGSMPSFTF